MKLILPERGTDQARATWTGATICVSSVALLAEVRAAIGLARRSSRLTDFEHAAAVRELSDRWSEMTGLVLVEALARRAGELADVCALRGYDAIHLASAEAVLDEGDIMVVSDTRLAEAAASIGIEALVPAES